MRNLSPEPLRVTVDQYRDDARERHYLEMMSNGRVPQEAVNFYDSPTLTDRRERIQNALAVLPSVKGRVSEIIRRLEGHLDAIYKEEAGEAA